MPVGRRPIEQASQQTLEVQRRTADEQRLLAAGADVGHCTRRRFDVLGHAELVLRIDDVDEVMRHDLPQSRGRLGRTDIHPAIDRHRVERNDLRTDPLGERNANGRLANRRGACEKPAIVKCIGHKWCGSVVFTLRVKNSLVGRDATLNSLA